jgi:hypothetical protein
MMTGGVANCDDTSLCIGDDEEEHEEEEKLADVTCRCLGACDLRRHGRQVELSQLRGCVAWGA